MNYPAPACLCASLGRNLLVEDSVPLDASPMNLLYLSEGRKSPSRRHGEAGKAGVLTLEFPALLCDVSGSSVDIDSGSCCLTCQGKATLAAGGGGPRQGVSCCQDGSHAKPPLPSSKSGG